MKIKSLLFTLLSLLSIFLLSMTVNAASSFKIGTPSSNSSSGNILVPINLETNSVELLRGYTFYFDYDESKYEYVRTIDRLILSADEYGTVYYGDIKGNVDEGVLKVSWVYSNDHPIITSNGAYVSKEVALIELKPLVQSNPSPNQSLSDEFSVETITLGGTDETLQNDKAEPNISCFHFTVTGDFNNTAIDTIGVQIGDGAIEPLDRCYRTTYVDGSTDYASAETEFVVNITSNTAATADITVYGHKADEDVWMPLGDTYTFKNFKIQKSSNLQGGN